MTNELSKKDYLKRYLEKEKDSERKRKKKTKHLQRKANVSRLKIIDQDIDIKSINFGDKIEEDDGDEAPIIAEIIDERPIEEKVKEVYESSRWKKINSDETSQSSATMLSASRDSKSGGLITDKREFDQNSSKRARRDSDSDISPPRVNKRRHDSDDDLSPLRSKNSRNKLSQQRSNQSKSSTKDESDSDISPTRHQNLASHSRKSERHDLDGDISPPRNRTLSNKTNSQVKYSSKRHDSGSDISPPRNRTLSKSNSQVKYSSKRYDSGSDISPPQHQTSSKSNNLAKYSSKRRDSGSDISPPRHRTSSKSSNQVKDSSKRHDSESDISPPRHRTSNNLSNRAKDSSKKQDSEDDISPRNLILNKSNSQEYSSKRHDSESDISPPRHQTPHNSRIHVKKSSRRYDSDNDDVSSWHQNHSPKKHKSRAGSQKNSDSDMSPPRSSSKLSTTKGKSRLDKTLSGLKAGLQDSETLQKEVQELKRREKTQLSTLGDEISGRNADTIIRDRRTGMKRDLIKEQEAKTEENKKAKEYEQKYNKWGKGIEQTEDKMEKFKDELYEMSKPLARYRDDEDLDEKLKAVIRDGDTMAEYIKKKKNKDAPNVPVYSGPPAPPNRFGILPGYRWDGVDRSNGFEKKYFEKINSTKAIQDEAYLWSVQDM